MTHRILPMLVVVFATTFSFSAYGELQEHQVLVLYNSQDVESQAIRDAYLAAHPLAMSYDLNFLYADPIPLESPSSTDVNRRYIHLDRFAALIAPGSALHVFLEAHPEILAIATTRGVPSAVSLSFRPSLSTSAGGIQGTFESGLARMRSDFGVQVVHGYYQSTGSFEGYLAANPESELRYLVTRLDSNNFGDFANPPSDSSHTDDVVALINRSVNLTVNKYEVSVLLDTLAIAEGFSSGRGIFPGIAETLFDAGFCVLPDYSQQFLHGPVQHAGTSINSFDAATDGPFTDEHPTLVLLSDGFHHNCGNSPCVVSQPCNTVGGPCNELDPAQLPGYVSHYKAHAAGFFTSVESFNGVNIHYPSLSNMDPDGPPNFPVAHGQAMTWIAAGGSFAFGHLREPGSLQIDANRSLQNLYVNGLSWGEAAWSGIMLNSIGVALGDPLAKVQVFNPDLNGDRVIDQADVTLITNAIIANDPIGDLNGDGLVDNKDGGIVDEALGRNCTSLVQPPIFLACPGNGCGNIAGNLVVNAADLAEVLGQWGKDHPPSDVNCDGIVNSGDLAIILGNWNLWLPDAVVDECDCINLADVTRVIAAWGLDPSSSEEAALADVNCDGVVGQADLNFVLTSWGAQRP